ncbi:hypothetical protein ACFL3K_01370 [Pseudomonadota bacterium]
MFLSTYGISPTQRGFNRFVHKAMDFSQGVEVFCIGAIFGEDVPFEGQIYCISYSSTFVPFIIRSIKPTSYLDIETFNQSEWCKNRAGKIPITSVYISSFGDDLSKIETGPRGMIAYKKEYWGNEFHGYRFQSNNEKKALFGYIQEALPVLFFDNYSTHIESEPSICASVKMLEKENDFEIDNSGRMERKSLDLDHMANARRTAPYSRFFESMNEPDSQIVPTIEEIMKWVLDVEREIFFLGSGGYSFGLWREGWFWELLRRTYHSRYQQNFNNFETFLFEIMTLIQGRVYGRINYEKYSSYTLKAVR